MKKEKNKNFSMQSHKIFDLNLDPYEISLFGALNSHGKSIFPGYSRLRKMLGNVCKQRIQKSLATLQQCNIIKIEKGLPGKSNNYLIYPHGVWVAKQPRGRMSHSPPVGCSTGYNNTKFNKTNKQETGSEFLSLVDKLKKRQELNK